MKKINLKFVDFWTGFDCTNNKFHKALSKRYEIVFSENPDFIIYSVYGLEHLKYDCVRIFYTGELYSPDFNIADYAISFDYIDYKDRHLRFPVFMLSYDEFKLKEIEEKRIRSAYVYGERDFCSFVYSNYTASTARDDFFFMLSNYKRVNSAGKHLNNIHAFIDNFDKLNTSFANKLQNKIDFETKHRFSIAFENTSYPGYLTEKVFDSLAAGCIPIYFGDKNINNDIFNDSIINCHEFNNFDEVIQEVISIDNSPELFQSKIASKIFKEDVFAYEDKLLFFLNNIFDQDPKQAYRRPSGYYSNLRTKYFKRIRLLNKLIYIKPIINIKRIVEKKSLSRHFKNRSSH